MSHETKATTTAGAEARTVVKPVAARVQTVAVRASVQTRPVAARVQTVAVQARSLPQGPPGSQDTRCEQHGDLTFTYTGSRLTLVEWADGFSKSITYDAQSRVETVTCSTGVVKTLVYDSQGRVTDVLVVP